MKNAFSSVLVWREHGDSELAELRLHTIGSSVRAELARYSSVEEALRDSGRILAVVSVMGLPPAHEVYLRDVIAGRIASSLSISGAGSRAHAVVRT